jgi:hypothetical protein
VACASVCFKKVILIFAIIVSKVMEYVPAEIVLEIIKHLKRSTLACICQSECSKYIRSGKICGKHQQKLLEIQAQNTIAAKNFREVNKSFSDAYNPRHITLNIGGSFCRLQQREIIIFNTKMCYCTLKQIHNHCTTENRIKNYQYPLLKSRFLAIKNLASWMRADVSLIFNNEKMENLIKSEMKNIESQGGVIGFIQKNRDIFIGLTVFLQFQLSMDKFCQPRLSISD